MTEDAKNILDRKLHLLTKWQEDNLKEVITLHYFLPQKNSDTKTTLDESKPPLGSYMKISGIIKKINLEARSLQISGESISIDSIVDIEEDLLNDLDD